MSKRVEARKSLAGAKELLTTEDTEEDRETKLFLALSC